MSNNLTLEEAVKVAVLTTAGFYKTDPTSVLVAFDGGIPRLYQVANFENPIDPNTLNKINFNFKSIAKLYKNQIQNKPSDSCVRIDLNSHELFGLMNEWSEEVSAYGEFGDSIEPIADTLDLYHSQGVDPRAIAISFTQLAENHPDAELEIVAMEKRGEDKFLLRAKTAPDADKFELCIEYFENYNHLKGLPEEELILLIARKDGQIQTFEKVLRIMGENSKVNMTFHAPVGNAFGEVKGDQTTIQHNYTPEQKQNLAEAAAEIQQLLTQLQNQGLTPQDAQQQVAQDLANKADNDPTVLGKLVKWGQSLGNTAANTTVTEAAKEVFKIALRLLSIPLP